jgi:hypothetical protein
MAGFWMTPIVSADEVLTRNNITADEILNMFIGKSLKGKVTSVSIIKLEGTGIVVEIDYRGYVNYPVVSFDAQIMKDGKRAGNVEVEENTLSGPDGSVRLAIQLAGITEGGSLESDSLEISVNKGSRRKQQYTFEFENSWGYSSGSSGSALVGTVKIEPIKITGPKQTIQFSRTALISQKARMGVMNQSRTAGVAAATAPTAAGKSFIKGKSNTGMCFHKKNGGWVNGNPVHLYACNQGQIGWKTWVYEANTGYIRNAENKSKCLHKKQDGWNNGNPIHLWDCTASNTANKTWNYNKSTGQISARSNSKKCIHKKLSNWNNNNPLHLWNCSAGGSANDSWKFVSTTPILTMPPVVLFELNQPNTEPTDTSRQGVDNQKIPLLADLENTEFEGSDFLGIKVFADKNPDSGVFYYHPLYYSLDWDPNKSQYGMDITYGIGVAEKQVRMGMILRSSHLRRHLEFVEDILKKQYDNFEALMEISGEAQVTLPNSLSSIFGVAKEDISAEPPALGQILISWITDPVGQETMVAALTGQLGVSGSVFLYPDGKDASPYDVPLYANLASRRTFGHIEWDREGGWLNTTPYPIVLNKMHALKIGDAVSVTTWDLDQALVPPNTQVEWIPTQVPVNLLQDFEHVWFDYEVDDCSTCDLAAVATILDDIADINAKILNIKVLSPISACNLGGADLKIRSNYINPGKTTSTTVVISLSDESEIQQELYYTAEGMSGQLGEYQVRGILPSGKPLNSDHWYPIEDLVLYIGPFQFQESFPNDVSCE